MNLKYAIVPYPIPEKLIKSKLIAQTQTSAVKNNSHDKCIVSYQVSYNANFSEYPNFDTAEDLLLFKSQNPKDWNLEHKDDNVEIDSEKRQIIRVAAGKKGWVYQAHFFEMETSKEDGLFCEDYMGVTCTSLSVKFFKADGSEITSAGTYESVQLHLDAECVRTEVLFKPSFDYELISGTIRLDTKSAEDCRIWVVGGVMELGALGTREFAKGMNLKYLGADEVIETDGRASKYMPKTIVGLPYQANQLKFIIKHNAGYRFKLMPALEYFRE